METPETPQLAEEATATEQPPTPPTALFPKRRGTRSLKFISRVFPGAKYVLTFAGEVRNTPQSSNLFSTLMRNRNAKRETLRNGIVFLRSNYMELIITLRLHFWEGGSRKGHPVV